MMMLHYNTPSPNSMLIKSYISTASFKRVPHPPYSQDLVLRDFGVFGTVKTHFEGCEFESEKELFEELQNFFKEKSKDYYISLFHEWEKRLLQCIYKWRLCLVKI